MVTLLALVEVALMFAASGELRWQSPAEFPVCFGPLDEPFLLCFNTSCAIYASGIVVWSWRTAATREVSG